MRRLVAGAALLLAGCAHTTRIESDPPMARVQVDGTDRGIAPVILEEQSGLFKAHRLRVEKEGYVPIEAVIVQSELVWPVILPSVCLAPLTLGTSCGGLFWSTRFAQSYEYKLSPRLTDADRSTVPTEKPDDDPEAVAPY